jgi:hypothetical protein
MAYVLLSDLHCHTWSMFSKTNPNGVNSRLRIILNELHRAANTAKLNGIDKMVIAGDLFHVRGSIDPEVLNPVQEQILEIMDMGITIYAIPGNHDLKSKETTELGSSIQTLGQMFSGNGSFVIANEPSAYTALNVAMIPWCSDNDDLLKKIEEMSVQVNNPGMWDLIIHAGIDDVLPGMPSHGLTSAALSRYGFRNVFAGHYHNRKQVAPGVWSIGATTHQTWSDVDTRAGFLIVEDDGTIREFDTHAPKFIDVSAMSDEDALLAASGNYIRFRGAAITPKDAEILRNAFTSAGALGVSIQSPRAVSSARTTTAATAGPARTVDESVMAYIDAQTIDPHLDRAEIKRRAVDVLTSVRSVEEA